MELNLLYIAVILNYALGQVIILRLLSEKAYKTTTYICNFFIMLVFVFMTVKFQWASNMVGLFLFCLIIPAFIMMVIIMVTIKHFSLKYYRLCFLVQIIYILTDTTSRAFSRIFSGAISDVMYCCCITLFAYILSYLFSKIYIKIKNLPLKDKKLFYFCLSNTFICLLICVSSFLILQYQGIRNKLVFLVSLCIFLVITSSNIISLVLYSKYIIRTYTGKMKEEDMENLVKYTRIIEDTYKNFRDLKHDYNNLLSSASDEKVAELQRLIENDSINISKYDTLKNLFLIQDTAIKSLLSSKLIDFINHDINSHFEMIDKIEDFYIDNFDLVRALGIILDNAFEEAVQTEEKWINVGITQSGSNIIFVVENSCRESPLSIESMITKGFTTKGAERGIGLHNFREIISSYPHCSYKLGRNEKNIFSVILTIAEGH